MYMDTNLVVACPHCSEFVIIEQLNCKIFRHGILKANLKQIDPHSSKELCESLIQNKLIHGCGRPFQLVERITENKKTYIAVACDYI
jgi:hypothetical protein